jgi:hypothetical protein
LSKFKPSLRRAAQARDDGPAFKTRTIKPGPGAEEAARTAAAVSRPVENNGSQDANPEEPSPNAFQKLGFIVALLFVFFRFSFLHEIISVKLHANFHIISVLGGLTYLFSIFSGQLFRAFKERSTWLWLGFAALMCVSTATSFWKGGSFPIFIDYIETALPVIFVIPAVVVTKGNIKAMVSVIGLACITTALTGVLNDDFKFGRLTIDAAGSDISDPNDYSAHLILMMPALAYLTLRAGRPFLLKLIGCAGLGLCLVQILSTGSRGAFVGMAITTLFIAVVSPKRVKFAIFAGVPILALVAIPFVPSSSLTRLSTMFSASASAKEGEAADSSDARLALLKASWQATLEHPVLGIGPGVFMDYQANSAAKENGQRGLWHVSHNTYTQVSSECGIPALLLYIGALGASLISLRKSSRSGDQELAVVAQFVAVMVVGFCACIIFLSLAYNVQLLVLSALSVAITQRLAATKSVAGDAAEFQPKPVAVLA